VPGPQFITNEPEMFWGLIVSFWVGNIMLLVLNLPLIGVFVKIILIPQRYLYPAIIFFICLGAYSVSNNVFDIYVTIFFGIVGVLLNRFGFHPAPILLGFILGPMMEENLRRALVISRGRFDVFLERPVSAVLLLLTLILILWPLIKAIILRVRRTPSHS